MKKPLVGAGLWVRGSMGLWVCGYSKIYYLTPCLVLSWKSVGGYTPFRLCGVVPDGLSRHLELLSYRQW